RAPTPGFCNCPKYIQQRVPDASLEGATHTAREASALDEPQRHWITRADTLFIASTHPDTGPDTSHRGGAPGFVRVLAADRLLWPDYVGNGMFQTLGNLTID